MYHIIESEFVHIVQFYVTNGLKTTYAVWLFCNYIVRPNTSFTWLWHTLYGFYFLYIWVSTFLVTKNINAPLPKPYVDSHVDMG